MHATLLTFFTLGILSGSFLLFLVQPLFSKMMLPLLGGSPAVWNTLMVFFQFTLLLGYLYVHLGVKYLGVRKHSLLHLVVVGLSVLALPLAVGEGIVPPVESEMPVGWLLLQAAVVVGVPFFVLSSNAPLLQAYFATTSHKSAHDPYFLYAASNVGSLTALLAYPFVVEPALRLNEQTGLYSYGYGVFLAFVVFCTVLLFVDFKNGKRKKAQNPTQKEESIRFKQIALWVALAFIPSSLLLGVTHYISTDIAAMPLLWVVPLALYLLTFILAFAKWQVFPLWLQGKIVYVLMFIAVLLFSIKGYGEFWAIGLNLLLFFFLALLCHSKLAHARPSASHLTGFYLWVSVGGVLGGAFNALAAPLLFDVPFEYVLMLSLALLALPWEKTKLKKLNMLWDALLPVILLGFVAMHYVSIKGEGYSVHLGGDKLSNLSSLFLALFLFFVFSRGRPARLALGSGLVMAFFIVLPIFDKNFEMAERSFFGAYQVRFSEERFSYDLWNGHNASRQGAQSILEEKRLDPSFFYPLEGVAENLPPHLFKSNAAVIGLGVGVFACLLKESPELKFYEIDPVIARIAQDESYFSYLHDCAPHAEIILGDGRLSIKKEKDDDFGIIVLDAFSATAVPAHLLSKEAFELYLRKLKADGVIFMNVTNLHLDLTPLVVALAKELSLTAYTRSAKDDRNLTSKWVVLARKKEQLGSLATYGLWEPLEADKEMDAWTDSFSNILDLL